MYYTYMKVNTAKYRACLLIALFENKILQFTKNKSIMNGSIVGTQWSSRMCAKQSGCNVTSTQARTP